MTPVPVQQLSVPTPVFLPQSYGARGDGERVETLRIQAAIDAAYAAGGGTVYFSAGRYLTGSLHLRSNVRIYVGPGAVILGSSSKDDYQRHPEVIPELSTAHPHGVKSLHEYNSPALFLAFREQNIAVVGEGVVDGQGGLFGRRNDPVYPANKGALHSRYRPCLFHFVECNGVTVSGLTLKNPCGWMQCHLHCDDVRVTDIIVDSVSAWNNDGIDVVGCRNVVIRGCRINAADDGICLKSTGRLVENVTISDCIVRSSASAFKCGTGSGAGFRNIVVDNLVVYDTARSGITLQVVDGGLLQNVIISNVVMRNVGNAIFLRLGDRSRMSQSQDRPGMLEDVVIGDVLAEITGFDADATYDFRAPRRSPLPNPLPSSVVGLSDAPVRNVHLHNVHLRYVGDVHDASAIIGPEECDHVPDERASYPEYDVFGELPAWGFYARHVDGLTMRDVFMDLRGSDPRPAVVLDNVRSVRCHGLQTPRGDRDVRLHHSRRVQELDSCE